MTFQRTMQQPPIGTPVYSRDGEQLGTVKEFRGTALKLDVTGQPDYWLPTGCLTEGAAGQVIVEATKDQIGDLTIYEPKAPKRR
jgi:hypothetical protein